ncbi:MAG: pyrimidine dimer DNA glycosylase/endonuclease V [Zestosphaera sp.]
MRLWSLHPKYLDRVGLLALWRECLLRRRYKASLRGTDIAHSLRDSKGLRTPYCT